MSVVILQRELVVPGGKKRRRRPEEVRAERRQLEQGETMQERRLI